ncbi:ATP-binding protein [Streptosporangium sp. NPDC000396]|uniref:ATP-binding protein n=1 Tax=Streptosporangium sp. NPDC000396 TaxID=3366185 RepID=UPI0036C3F7F1
MPIDMELRAALTVRQLLAGERFLAVLGEKTIPGKPECVASTRRFVRDIARDWGASEEICEVAELLTSEVVTNALVHGRGCHDELTVHVVVHREGQIMIVEVYDGNRNAPVVLASDDCEESGRGMALVGRLARSWGYRDTRLGKAVFFDLLAWP